MKPQVNSSGEPTESFLLADIPAKVERELARLARANGTDSDTEASRLIEEHLLDEDGVA